MKKTILVLLIVISCFTITAQEKYDYMIITYFPGLNLIFVANNGAETIQEEIHAEKKDRLAGTPLLQKVKTYQSAGWEVMNFEIVSTTGKEFYCYLRKKQ